MDSLKSIVLGFVLVFGFAVFYHSQVSWRDAVATSVENVDGPPGSRPQAYPRMTAESSQEYLIERLHNGTPEARKKAVGWLASRNTSEADQAITAALEDESLEVRIAALEVLGRKAAPGTLEKILAMARQDAAYRGVALEVLGSYPPRPAIKAFLLELLQEPDASTRIEVALQLAKYPPDREVLPVLVGWFADPCLEVRRAVRDTLSHYYNAYHVDCLRLVYEQMNGGDAMTRRAAAEFLALKCKDDPLAVKAVAVAARKPDLDVAEVAHELLIRNNDPQDVPVLIATLHEFNDLYVAENLLNSGNAKLEQAAREWAKANGVAINTGLRRSYVNYRRMKPDAGQPATIGGQIIAPKAPSAGR